MCIDGCREELRDDQIYRGEVFESNNNESSLFNDGLVNDNEEIKSNPILNEIYLNSIYKYEFHESVHLDIIDFWIGLVFHKMNANERFEGKLIFSYKNEAWNISFLLDLDVSQQLENIFIKVIDYKNTSEPFIIDEKSYRSDLLRDLIFPEKKDKLIIGNSYSLDIIKFLKVIELSTVDLDAFLQFLLKKNLGDLSKKLDDKKFRIITNKL